MGWFPIVIANIESKATRLITKGKLRFVLRLILISIYCFLHYKCHKVL